MAGYKRSTGYDPSMGYTYGMDLPRRLRSRPIRTYDPDWTSKYNAEVDRIEKFRNPLQTEPFPGFARQPQPEINAALPPMQGPAEPPLGQMAGWMGLTSYGKPGPAPPPQEPYYGAPGYTSPVGLPEPMGPHWQVPYGPGGPALSSPQSTGAQSAASSYYYNPDNLAKQGLGLKDTGYIGSEYQQPTLSPVAVPGPPPSAPPDVFDTISGVASSVLSAATGPLGAAVGLIGSLLEGTPEIEDPDPERLSYNRAQELMNDASSTNRQVFHGLRKQALATQPTQDTVSSLAVQGGARGNQAAVLGLLNALASNRRALDAATTSYADWVQRREGAIVGNLRTDLEGRMYMSRAKAERDATYASPWETLLKIEVGSIR